MGLPIVHIEFKKLAETVAARTSNGTVAVVVLDGKQTSSGVTVKTFNSAAQLSTTDFSATNIKAISRAFLANPQKVVVVRMQASAAATEIAGAIDRLSFDWICTNASSTHQNAIVTAVKAMNASARRAKKVKAVVTGVTSADDMHIVNFANTAVTVKGDSSTTSASDYLPRIAGILAACPITESTTYKVLDDLESVVEPDALDTSIDGGNFCLFNDDDAVRVARGVNTLQTVSGDVTVDMKKIAVVEAMDAIQNDIATTFKNSYLGKVRNSADNQALFLSDVVAYFNNLAVEGIIDTAEDSPYAAIDVAAMRTAWTADGVDVSDLTDAQILHKTYKANVYIKANCRIFDAMEDINMTVMLG